VESEAENLPKQSIANLARCIAALCCSSDAAKCEATVQRFINDVEKAGSSDASKHLALLCIGEVGSVQDLSAQANLQAVILGAFETGSEETKSAAAYALGHVTVGNMATYLPVVLEALTGGRNQYLLLSALKEVSTRV
jgi:cullin-associated NEDD8-dissociated protein 1